MVNEAGVPQHLDDLGAETAGVARRDGKHGVLARIGDLAPHAHSITVRDLRERYGDPEEYQPQCSCGWIGERHTGGFAARSAGREGDRHGEEHRRSGSRR